MFYEIFSKEFNISFSNPRFDVCTTCKYKTALIKAEVDEATIRTKKRGLQVHKARGKAYYELIKEKKKQPFNHVVTFNIQQVQVLPKVPIQETFYSRQLGLYNLGLCDVSNEKNYSYTWTENQSYGEQLGKDLNLDVSEIKRFVGILLCTGFVPMP